MNTRLNYLIARERSPNGSCRRPSARLPLTGLSPLQFQLTANHQQQRDDHPLRPQTLDPGAPGDGRLPRDVRAKCTPSTLATSRPTHTN